MYKFLLKLTDKTYVFEVDNKEYFYSKIEACRNVFALFPYTDVERVNDWTAFGNAKHEVPALRDEVNLSITDYSIELVDGNEETVVSTPTNNSESEIEDKKNLKK